EWDAVALVRWVSGELPGSPCSTQGWLALGALPHRFRGDRAALPDVEWDRTEVLSRTVIDRAITAFAGRMSAYHEAEERRLAYVALTRARSDLLVTGSWWASQQRPRKPTEYLSTVIDALGLDLITPTLATENPRA